MMLKDIRNKKNLSQSQLSELSGVTLRMIQQWEQGKKDINSTKLKNLAALAETLDCPISHLLTDEELVKQLRKVSL